MKVSEIVNSLIADEWIAHNQYITLSTLCNGPMKEQVSNLLIKLSHDEYFDHYNRLSQWQKQHNFNIMNDPFDMLRTANGKFIQFDDKVTTLDSLYIIVKAETGAISAYKKYAKAVSSSYPDLAEMFIEIAKEEDQHKLDALDLIEQIKLQP